MKQLKTRIRKETKANGAVEYRPEYKGWLFWYPMVDRDSPSFIQDCVSIYVDKNPNLIPLSKETAKGIIDAYVERVKYKNACDIENRVLKVDYEDYP